MTRRLTRFSLWVFLLLSGQVWAIGLGDIVLDSALNEPLRAEIDLLSATPEELAELEVRIASSETFSRYGIDRPFFLQDLEFMVVNRGLNGSVVQIRSRSPISEPFVTFLIEATWPSGRLLREYTVLLDPPTYAPPSTQQSAIEAPRQRTPNDSGRIERPAPPPPPAQPEPVVEAPVETPRPREAARTGTDPGFTPAPAPEPEYSAPADTYTDSVADSEPYSQAQGGQYTISKGQTLWSLSAHLRPDSRLTINQTMLAIFEANPDAFDGNINLMKAGATLRIPSADEVFQISRADALQEVQRQHSAWGGSAGYDAPVVTSRPSLTLVPPDEDTGGGDYADTSVEEPLSREEEIEARIAELQAADVPNQQSLITIRDNELAALRQELAEIRGEIYEPPLPDPVDEPAVADGAADDVETDSPFVDEIDSGEPVADDAVADAVPDEADDGVPADDAAAADDAADTAIDDSAVPTNVITTSTADEESILDRIIAFLSDWGIIIAAVIAVIGGVLWFLQRRGGGAAAEEEPGRPWETQDAGAAGDFDSSATATIQAPTPDEAIVVVEQDSGVQQPVLDDTVEAPAADFAAGGAEAADEPFGSIEDTFSSETAVNLDASDPIAEADFHMAYGLYDQAADLINSALQTDSSDRGLLSKLCEIYFVWGNRDEFVSAATRLKDATGGGASGDWDKVVIMGQQIAADHELFAGAEMAGATREVDLSFGDDGGGDGGLDMDFGEDTMADAGSEATQGGVDFNFDDTGADDAGDFAATIELPESDATVEMPETDVTAEMPTPDLDDALAEGGTSELPALDASLQQAISDSGMEAEATAEINLDDLDFGGDDFDATEIASMDDIDATGRNEALTDTGINEALDLEATDVDAGMGEEPTEFMKGLDIENIEDTGMRLAADETGQNPLITAEIESQSVGLDVDDSLLEATGVTQVLSEEQAAEVGLGDDEATMLAPSPDSDPTEVLSGDAETMLAPLDDDDGDFSNTEALPSDAFTGNAELDATAETPAIAGTDVDLDLDDLTAALQVSEIGDNFAEPDATAEQPQLAVEGESGDMDGDLHEARTMTEVGTKLDLARAYVDMGDPAGARSILEEVLDEGDDGQKQQAQQLLDSLPS